MRFALLAGSHASGTGSELNWHTVRATRAPRPDTLRHMHRESVKSSAVRDLSRTHGDDRLLAELARRQHGVVGREQLLRIGWSKDEVNWRLRSGRLHRLHRGVYA